MPYFEVAAALLASSILPWMPRPATGCSIDKVRQRENQKEKKNCENFANKNRKIKYLLRSTKRRWSSTIQSTSTRKYSRK